jgi:hypothetical protein
LHYNGNLTFNGKLNIEVTSKVHLNITKNWFINFGIGYYSFNYNFSQTFGILRRDTFNVYARNIGLNMGIIYLKNFNLLIIGAGISYHLYYANIQHENLTENKIVIDNAFHQPFEGSINGIIPPAPKKNVNNSMTLTLDFSLEYKITTRFSILLNNKLSSYGARYTDETKNKTNDYHYVYLTGYYRNAKGEFNINYIPAIGIRYFID